MKIIVDVSQLNKDQLVEALVYTNSPPCACSDYDGAVRIRHELESYYQLLSIAELRSKAKELIMMDKGLPSSPIEQKRIAMKAEQIKIQRPRDVRIVDIKPSIKLIDKQHLVQTLIMGKKSVAECIVIAPGYLGVKIKAGYSRKKVIKNVTRLVEHEGWNGVVIYG